MHFPHTSYIKIILVIYIIRLYKPAQNLLVLFRLLRRETSLFNSPGITARFFFAHILRFVFRVNWLS